MDDSGRSALIFFSRLCYIIILSVFANKESLCWMPFTCSVVYPPASFTAFFLSFCFLRTDKLKRVKYELIILGNNNIYRGPCSLLWAWKFWFSFFFKWRNEVLADWKFSGGLLFYLMNRCNVWLLSVSITCSKSIIITDYINRYRFMKNCDSFPGLI